MESNDSPEIPDRGEDIRHSRPPFGGSVNNKGVRITCSWHQTASPISSAVRDDASFRSTTNTKLIIIRLCNLFSDGKKKNTQKTSEGMTDKWTLKNGYRYDSISTVQ